jgi:hypothetical protein
MKEGPSRRSQLRSVKWMHTLHPALRPVDVQASMPEIDLRPTKRAQLLRTQAMPVRQQDSASVPSSIAPTLPRSLDQAFNLLLSEIFPNSVG